MLAHLTQSSKRLKKLKNYKNKGKPQQGFEFLLQSLERDKENQMPNGRMTLPVGNMVQSVNVEAVATAPNQLRNRPRASNTLNSAQGWFDNVKMLEHSEVSEEDEGVSVKPKGKKKKSQKGTNKRVDKSVIPSGKRTQATAPQSDQGQLIYKVKQYLALTSQLLNSHPTWQHTSKAKRISQQLVTLLIQMSPVGRERRSNGAMGGMLQSVETTAFDIGSKGEAYMKIISSLEMEKEKLNSLISQHQMANIKMFIKINEGESDEIEQCKKHLAMLFQKYKTLEGLILKDRTKIAQLTSDKQTLQLECQQHQKHNEELMQLVEEYQSALEKAKKELVSQPPRQQKKENEMDLQESRKTNKEKSKGGRMGINLQSLLQNVTQKSISKLAQDPAKLKQVIIECRSTIRRLESTIDQQNKELQFSVNALQQNQSKMQEKDSLMLKLSARHPNPPSSLAVTTRKYHSENLSRGQDEDYRIIALQAAALEEVIRAGRIR